ncbi:MAG: hypothetical protein IIB09_05080 [Bacteroidetes bacterium]|nr:hypothetical protein [Bacteroidota bacterium]
MNVTVRLLEIDERGEWSRMREVLFPECDDTMHAFEMDRHSAKNDDDAVLAAIDEPDTVCTFIELTICGGNPLVIAFKDGVELQQRQIKVRCQRI